MQDKPSSIACRIVNKWTMKTLCRILPLLGCLFIEHSREVQSFSIIPSIKNTCIGDHNRQGHNSRVQYEAKATRHTTSSGEEGSTTSVTSRRQTLESITKGIISSSVLSSLLFKTQPTIATDIPGGTATREHPIAIIGGGGRTGMAVAEILAGEEGKMNGVTMTRSGKDPYQVVKLPPTVKERLRHFEKPVDVRDAEGVLKAMKEISPSVVVYAASASKQGGNSFDVDDKGVENVARACKDVGAKFILISALAVDRPDSKSFKITNTIGGYMDKIMDAKLNGEMKTREIMGKDYIIIRPGVLLSGKSLKGAADIELNQGDTIGGGLSRDELAGVVMGAIQSGKSGITVEAYRTKTATKLEPELPIPSGNELKASSYSELFANSKSD